MPPAPQPETETARLASLKSYDILDTPADPRFDTFTRLASQLNDTPMSAISLIDDHRQWFKSKVGLAIEETPRDIAFCAHAILRPEEVMVVEDATADTRFIDNPLVNGDTHIRFYAGAPLRDPSGLAIGTLCLIDVKPRQMTAKAREQLADLAAGVSSVMELHRSNLLLHWAATHDALTGLNNRASFEHKLAEAIRREGPGAIAVLCLDLDRFKQINDTFGHSGGDTVLAEIGKRLAAAVRGSDVVGRLGGDEFAVMMISPVAPDGPDGLAKRLVAALEQPVQIEQSSTPIRTSIGIALFPTDAADAAGLLRCADLALFQAKHAGRGVSRRFASDSLAMFSRGPSLALEPRDRPTPTLRVVGGASPRAASFAARAEAD